MKSHTTALIVVAALAFGCRPGERLGAPAPAAPAAPPPAPAAAPSGGLPRTEPSVRIGITVDSTSTTVGAPVEFEVRALNGRALARGGVGEAWTFTTTADGRITARSASGVELEPAAAPVRIVPRDLSHVTIDGRRYRGDVLLLAPRAGRITAVNVVDLEAYLLGVVPREMGKRPATEIEALKAQAVAARTYAVGNLGGRSTAGFDFYATVMDQVYGGTADEDSIVSRAVKETRGTILTYAGAPILAYYSSTCGGSTAAIEESWPTREPLPYLRSVSDRIPGTDESYCQTSSRFRWTTAWTRRQLLDVLSTTLRAHTKNRTASVRAVQDVRITDRGPSGRATVELTADGTTYTLRADSLRWVLRPTPAGGILNSARLYDVRVARDGDEVDHLEIDGGGWGHAIGMCQVGAMGRARAGQSFSEILKSYYTGVAVEQLY